MKTDSINLDFAPKKYGYRIEFGYNYFDDICQKISFLANNNPIVLLSDSNVSKLYAPVMIKKLTKLGNSPVLITFPSGEKSKSAKVKEQIESKMINSKIDRQSIFVALGGGVTGDLGGFVAATYMRGIPFIQIPTSLLAMVDSSIGGKVAINHPYGKNMIGAFYQPKAVFIDISMLKTLPHKEFLNGLSEIIKSALIMDKDLFSFIEDNKKMIKKRSNEYVKHLVVESCKIKSAIVTEDEKEKGIRKLLNYGHTIGHAVEALSMFRIPHGFSVSIGMDFENILAYKIGLMNFEDLIRIRELLLFFELPFKIPAKMNHAELIKKMSIDKKSSKGIPSFTLLKGIGKGSIDHKVDISLILEALRG